MGQISIRSPDTEDRVAQILSTSFSLGSSLKCDYIIFEDGISERHLEFSITQHGMTITVLGEGPVRVSTKDGNSHEYSTGEIFQWSPEMILNISGVSVELLDMVSPQKRVAAPKVKTLRENIKFPKLALFAAFSSVVWASASYSSLFSEEQLSLEYNGEIPVLEPTSKTLKSQFEEAGFKISNVKKMGTEHVVSAYTSGKSEGDALKIYAKSLGQGVRVRAYDATTIKSQIPSILKAVDAGGEVKSFENGRLLLKGVVDPTLRERLSDIITSDVPGVQSVEFVELSSNETAEFMKDRISAVWIGDNPYVLMNNEIVIRPGDELSDGISLKSIKTAEVLIVTDGSRDWEFNWYE